MLYIIVSIKLHIGNNTNKGHYVYSVLNYNTGTWWNCDDETMTQYPGYPYNVFDDLSIYKKQKREKVCMDRLDRIVSMLYIKKDIFASRNYSLITGNSVSKDTEQIIF